MFLLRSRSTPDDLGQEQVNSDQKQERETAGVVMDNGEGEGRGQVKGTRANTDANGTYTSRKQEENKASYQGGYRLDYYLSIKCGV